MNNARDYLMTTGSDDLGLDAPTLYSVHHAGLVNLGPRPQEFRPVIPADTIYEEDGSGFWFVVVGGNNAVGAGPVTASGEAWAITSFPTVEIPAAHDTVVSASLEFSEIVSGVWGGPLPATYEVRIEQSATSAQPVDTNSPRGESWDLTGVAASRACALGKSTVDVTAALQDWLDNVGGWGSGSGRLNFVTSIPGWTFTGEAATSEQFGLRKIGTNSADVARLLLLTE